MTKTIKIILHGAPGNSSIVNQEWVPEGVETLVDEAQARALKLSGRSFDIVSPEAERMTPVITK